MQINSCFDLNGSVRCLGIWAPGICCLMEYSAKGLSAVGPWSFRDCSHSMIVHRSASQDFDSVVTEAVTFFIIDEHLKRPVFRNIIHSSMKKSRTQLNTRCIKCDCAGYM